MNTKSLLTAIVVGALSSSVGYAQRVEATSFEGHPVINCEAMPASLYTTIPKSNTDDATETQEENEKVYGRFAIYKTDNSTSSTWSNALTVCSGISGGKWRLPTLRELMLMWVLAGELRMVTKFNASRYWSATKGNTTSTIYYLDFDDGEVSDMRRSDNAGVRCIMELPMP